MGYQRRVHGEAALSEAEGVLEQTENKVLRAAFELEQVKKEIARRVDEKEIEFANTRKNYSKAVDGMQVALESETKSKVELSRIKKKLEADVLDLTANLEHANASNTEAQKNIKRISNSIRDMQTKFEDENHAKTGEQDRLLTGERKANSLNNNLEEFKTLLEQADRNRRMLEQELADTNETLSELTCANQSINGAKQKCENRSRPLDLILMKCLLRPTCQRRRQREPWWMLLVLPMSSAVSRMLPCLWRERTSFLKPRSRMPRLDAMKLSRMP